MARVFSISIFDFASSRNSFDLAFASFRILAADSSALCLLSPTIALPSFFASLSIFSDSSLICSKSVFALSAILRDSAPSTKIAKRNVCDLISPAASGCLAIACATPYPINPIPIPAPITANPAPIVRLLFC